MGTRRFHLSLRRRCIALAGVAAVVSCAAGVAEAASCGDVLGPGGQIALDSDLEDCSGAGPALTIVGPVIVDLEGHRVRCAAIDPAAGIEIIGQAAQVSNGSLQGCRSGFRAGGQGGHRLTDLAARGNDDFGFAIEADRNTIDGCSAIDGVDDGIRIAGSNNSIVDSIAVGNGANGYTVSGDDNRITSQTATNSGKVGMEVSGDANRLTQITIATSGQEGIVVSGASNRWKQVQSNRSLQTGVLISGSSNDLDRVTATHNVADGFRLSGATSTRVRRSTASNNGAQGFDIDGSRNNLRELRADGNDIGIDVKAGADNEISRSAAFANLSFDVQDRTACAAAEWSDNRFRTSGDPCIE